MSHPAFSRASDLGTVVTVQTPDGPRDVDLYSDEGFHVLTQLWTRSGWQHKLTYELTSFGIPIIQMPEDIQMMQELLWRLRPDVVIESGVAHGGALVMYAGVMELIGNGHVVGVDVEIRKYNRLAISSHPFAERITLIEGDSVAEETLEQVRSHIRPGDRVLVALDSNHTKAHVAAELERYAPLVTPNSYCVVFDTIMTMVSDAPSAGSNWDEDNPAAAIEEFLAANDGFEVDPYYNRLGATYVQNGFLKRREADRPRRTPG